jgi:hypothetical protein
MSVLVDSLVYRHPGPHVEGFLPPAELLQRVTNRFPLAVIDRERGDRIIREGVDRLAELMSPTDTIVDHHRALIGRVAYVTIRVGAGRPQFGFLLYPHPTVIEIDYERPEDRDACRPLLEALAAELEYDIESEDLED